MKAKEFLAEEAKEKLCSCGCEKPLEPRIDGMRQTINGKEVNADCYFATISPILEKHLIGKR
jgi:hypothetical protein